MSNGSSTESTANRHLIVDDEVIGREKY